MKIYGYCLLMAIGIVIFETNAQPVIPVKFEINGAADIRAVFDPTFTDQQFDGAKGLATDGNTFVIGRTNKIDYNTAPTGQDPLIPGELLIYRKNTSGTGPEFNLVARLNDSVVGTSRVSLVEPDDQFGWTVAISGNTMVVGSPYYPHVNDVTSTNPGFVQDTLVGYGGEDETGAVFVYTRPKYTSNAWTLDQVIYDSQPVNGERFGHNVLFHDNRLLISSPRNFRPGYSEPRSGPGGPVGTGHCENISSSIEVYEISSQTGKFELSQTIELPFLPHEANYGIPPNGDPVDSVGDCSPFPSLGFEGIPPIDSRNGIGFDLERARDFAVDGPWLITVGQPGIFVYKRDSITAKYHLSQGLRMNLPNGASSGNSASTSISVSDGVAVVGIKKYTLPGHNEIGGLAIYEYDPALMEWEQTTIWNRPDFSGSKLGMGVSLFKDTVVAYSQGSKVAILRYDRSTNELLHAGDVLGAGSGNPANKTAQYGDLFLLSDNISRISISPGINTNIVRAVSTCPYDLNSDGALNFYDVSAYMALHQSGDLQADYAYPYGTLDSDDTDHFLALYNSGCP
ncbi:GC-type dockerin domain-anchored protein [Microbulbifer sp. TYP-18]|uniref:GC-type dockerin domain-anchored protein n=1 Tax=Microbulbifer sp. TYP-18 TaxID=3230024 RepID=UPI0034C6AB2D